jgi:hypothetical protein
MCTLFVCSGSVLPNLFAQLHTCLEKEAGVTSITIIIRYIEIIGVILIHKYIGLS